MSGCLRNLLAAVALLRSELLDGYSQRAPNPIVGQIQHDEFSDANATDPPTDFRRRDSPRLQLTGEFSPSCPFLRGCVPRSCVTLAVVAAIGYRRGSEGKKRT